MVERILAKDKIRVRFSVSAQDTEIPGFMLGIFVVFARYSKQTALLASRIEKRSHVERSETGELGEEPHTISGAMRTEIVM